MVASHSLAFIPRQVPRHSSFTLLANSEQVLSGCFGRRLITLKKTSDYSPQQQQAVNGADLNVRDHYFQSRHLRPTAAAAAAAATATAAAAETSEGESMETGTGAGACASEVVRPEGCVE
jgi:hypothetical protein